MKKFEFLPHTADAKIRAYGKTLNEVFENTALGVFELITNTKKIEPKVSKEFSLKSEDKEALMYDFIAELIFLHDTQKLVFSKFKVSIKELDKGFELSCLASGEEFNIKKHEENGYVKAMTYSEMKIEKQKSAWVAEIVVDM